MNTRSIVDDLMGRYGCTFTPPSDHSYNIAGSGENGVTQGANAGTTISQVSPDLRRDDMFREYLTKAVQLPEDNNGDATLWPPDHVEEARHECTVQFIEQVLLPRLREKKELSAIELVRLATQFKSQFRSAHAQDFLGDYELIPAAEMALIQMQVRLRARDQENTALYELVIRAGHEIKRILDADDGYILYTI